MKMAYDGAQHTSSPLLFLPPPWPHYSRGDSLVLKNLLDDRSRIRLSGRQNQGMLGNILQGDGSFLRQRARLGRDENPIKACQKVVFQILRDNDSNPRSRNREL